MDPIALFTNLGLGTALVVVQVWFLRYLVTRTIPDILVQHREELAALRGDMERRHEAVMGRFEELRQEGCGWLCRPQPREAGK
jgi:hypothetical protein